MILYSFSEQGSVENGQFKNGAFGVVHTRVEARLINPGEWPPFAR